MEQKVDKQTKKLKYTKIKINVKTENRVWKTKTNKKELYNRKKNRRKEDKDKPLKRYTIERETDVKKTKTNMKELHNRKKNRRKEDKDVSQKRNLKK
jgi:hypothetical protein